MHINLVSTPKDEIFVITFILFISITPLECLGHLMHNFSLLGKSPSELTLFWAKGWTWWSLEIPFQLKLFYDSKHKDVVCPWSTLLLKMPFLSEYNYPYLSFLTESSFSFTSFPTPSLIQRSISNKVNYGNIWSMLGFIHLTELMRQLTLMKTLYLGISQLKHFLSILTRLLKVIVKYITKYQL